MPFELNQHYFFLLTTKNFDFQVLRLVNALSNTVTQLPSSRRKILENQSSVLSIHFNMVVSCLFNSNIRNPHARDPDLLPIRGVISLLPLTVGVSFPIDGLVRNAYSDNTMVLSFHMWFLYGPHLSMFHP